MENEKNTEAIYDARVLGKGRMFVLGLQHMFAMFGATVLVPAISCLFASSCCSSEVFSYRSRHRYR